MTYAVIVLALAFFNDVHDAPKIVGRWEVQSYIRHGKASDARGDSYEFRNGSIFFTSNGKEETYVFKLTRFDSFFRIESFAELEGGLVLATRGILRLEGDVLTICYGDPFIDGYPFPKDFTESETKKGVLVRLRRGPDK